MRRSRNAGGTSRSYADVRKQRHSTGCRAASSGTQERSQALRKNRTLGISPRFRDRGVGKPSGVKAVGTFRRRPWTFVQTSPTGTINGENALDATRLGTFPACHTPEGFPSPLPPFRRTIPLYAICAGSVNIYFNRCEFGIRALERCCFPVGFFLMQSGRTVGAFLEIISESLPAFSVDGAMPFTPACFTAGCCLPRERMGRKLRFFWRPFPVGRFESILLQREPWAISFRRGWSCRKLEQICRDAGCRCVQSLVRVNATGG